jgi:uncharacterized metal-binding protein YceD (DUF177 family)
MTEPAPEFSFPIDVADITAAGRAYKLKASAQECADVAERLDLQAVDALSADLEVVFVSGGFIKVSGEMKAHVTQSCVVTLGPVPARIADVVNATFITEERAAKEKAKLEKAKARRKATDEEEVRPDEEDPPEVARGGRIDLGEIVVVHLALALDPYPRVPGAAFDAKAWGVEPEMAVNPEVASPFAALASFKKAAKTPGSGSGQK